MLRRFLPLILVSAILWPASQSAASQQGSSKSGRQPSDSSQPLIEIQLPVNGHSSGSRQDDVEGTCYFAVVVDTNGIVRNVRAIQCFDPPLISRAVQAIKKHPFAPAHRNGATVMVLITVSVKFESHDGFPLAPGITYAMVTPPETKSCAPDLDGAYPLTRQIYPPGFSRFAEGTFSKVDLSRFEDSTCKVLLTIDAKGRPSDARVMSCGHAELEQPAINALMHSRYEPGLLHGRKRVPVRVLVKLFFQHSTDEQKLPALH
jgi:Gram-negative bacterial TonB protein C-terminal